MVRSTRPLAAIAFAFSIVITACAQTGGTPTPSGSAAGSAAAGSTITVTSLWGGSEQASFQKVLDAFKAKTGISANYESPQEADARQDRDVRRGAAGHRRPTGP